MAAGTLGIRAVGFRDALDGALERVEQPFSGEVGKSLVKAMRTSIREEFRGQFWKTPGGGRLRWKPTKPFGDKPAPPKALGGEGGSLARAWMGGKGGTSKVTDRTVSISVDLPYASVHRGGTGFRASASQVTVVKPRRGGARGRSAMAWKLGMGFGVWMPEDRLAEGLEIPSRPHATRNPDLNDAMAKIVAKAIGKKR